MKHGRSIDYHHPFAILLNAQVKAVIAGVILGCLIMVNASLNWIDWGESLAD
jgi:hypothetical protein